MSSVVPHLRGECPIIPPVHWKGCALPRQRSLRTLKTVSNFNVLYSLFSTVKIFSIFESFLKMIWFDRFFYLGLIEFLNKIF